MGDFDSARVEAKKLTEREKLVITAYTGYVLEGTAGKVVDFVEQELGHSIQTPEPPAVWPRHASSTPPSADLTCPLLLVFSREHRQKWASQLAGVR